MKTVTKSVLKWAGYSAFFLVCFLMFMYWTFPYDHVRNYIIQEVERPVGPGGERHASGYHLEIDDLSPYWLSGVELEGVRFSQDPEDPERRATVTTIDEVTARVSIWSLLFGGADISFDVTVGDGTIEGEFDSSEDETHIEAEFTDVDLHRLGVLADRAGVPIAGKLNGNINVTIAKENANTQGEIALTIARLTIGAQGAKIAGFTIGRIQAGDLTIAATVEHGTARITRFASNGQDIALRVGGTVRLLQPLRTSSFDVVVNAEFSDAFRTRDDRTRAVFSMLDMNPAMQAARTPDGALQWQVQFTPSRPLRYTAAGRAPAPH